MLALRRRATKPPGRRAQQPRDTQESRRRLSFPPDRGAKIVLSMTAVLQHNVTESLFS